MAKQPQQPPKPQGQPQEPLAPYPKDWAKMSKDDRQTWMKKHRPNRPTGVPAKPAAPPAPAPKALAAAQPPAGGQGEPVSVKIRVALWSVQVGDREPVECPGSELGNVVTGEQQAYENDHQDDTATEGEHDDSQDEEES